MATASVAAPPAAAPPPPPGGATAQRSAHPLATKVEIVCLNTKQGEGFSELKIAILNTLYFFTGTPQPAGLVQWMLLGFLSETVDTCDPDDTTN